ncbi:hypothetical protein V1517DRAFT_314327 [Lipomyces orientalis]|uniref:Uncharacterized protein n=1 Tax=Lipomyces orientalis TaxID=1233043 RepID=A0ACC3TXK9_9ASCO
MSLSIEEMAKQVAQITCCRLDDALVDVRFTRNVERSVDRFLSGQVLSGVSPSNPVSTTGTNNNLVQSELDVIMIDDSPVRVLEPSFRPANRGKRISGCGRNILASNELALSDVETDDDDDIRFEPMISENHPSMTNFSQTQDAQAGTQLVSSPPEGLVRYSRNNATADAPRVKPPLQIYDLVDDDQFGKTVGISDTNISLADGGASHAAAIRSCPSPGYKSLKKKSGHSLDFGSDGDDPIDDTTCDDLDLPDVQSFFDKFNNSSTLASSTAPLSVHAKRSDSPSCISGTKSTSGMLASIAASKQAHQAASTILPKSYADIEVEDLIETSSSSPIGIARSLSKRKQSDIDNVSSARQYSANTRLILEKLDSFNVNKFANEYKKQRADKGIQNTAERVSSEEEVAERSKIKKRNQQENIGYSRKREQAAKKQTSHEKENEREQKRKEKEQIAVEKQREKELAAVNKLKISKKDTCAEMIVDIDSDFAKTAGGQQLRSILMPLGIEVSTSWTSLTRNMVKWRRKVKSEYNAALGHFVPIPEEVRKEDFVLIVLTGVQFVDMVIENGLINNVTSIRRMYPNQKLIYMIEGLNSFFKKMRTQTQREFNNMVQDALGNATSKTKNPRSNDGDLFAKVQKIYNYRIHPDLVEDALIMLQVIYDCLVFHSTTALDSAEWVAILTQDIGTIPYKKARLNIHETICMESGQVKAGANNKDTFSQTLQQVKYVTPSLSKAISDKYGTIDEMMKTLDIRGPNTFLAIGGDASSRKIGQTLAKNLNFIFSSTDPNAFVP